jgi:hypothetical protein
MVANQGAAGEASIKGARGFRGQYRRPLQRPVSKAAGLQRPAAKAAGASEASSEGGRGFRAATTML